MDARDWEFGRRHLPVCYGGYMRRWDPPKPHMAARVAAILAVFILCMLMSCRLPTSGDFPRGWETWMQSEWEIAQCRISHLTPAPERDPFSIAPESMRVLVAKDGIFPCGGELSVGCHFPGARMIWWNKNAPGVLRHEFGHHIMHILNDARAGEYEHHSDPADPLFTITTPHPLDVCGGP